MNPWDELDKKTFTVDTVDKFKMKLSEFGRGSDTDSRLLNHSKLLLCY